MNNNDLVAGALFDFGIWLLNHIPELKSQPNNLEVMSQALKCFCETRGLKYNWAEVDNWEYLLDNKD